MDAMVIGLVYGSIYGIAALGFGLIYSTTRIFHIAYGSFAILGTYVVTSVTMSGPVLLVLAVVAGIAATVLATALAYRVVYAFIQKRGGNQGILFVASLGLALIVQAGILLGFGSAPRAFGFDSWLQVHAAVGVHYSYLGLAAIGLGLMTCLGLAGLLGRTTWGFKVLGLSSNEEQAFLVGINTKVVTMSAWMLAASLSLVAALLLAMNTTLTASAGTELTLFAWIAVVCAGIGRFVGAYVIGLGLGLVQAIVGVAIPGEWGTTAVFIAFLAMLIARPQGIFTARLSEVRA